MPLIRLVAAIAAGLFLVPPPLVAQAVPDSRAAIQMSFAPLVRDAAPAVVNIYATRVVADRVNPFAADPFFRDFFGDLGRAQPRVQNSLGSGVILTADGLVVSNYHVVGGAQDIRAVLADRREFAADLLLADEESDLAVLRLRDAQGLPVLPLADSDAAQVGDLVLAIGNPFGVGQTVSSGIVSALGRSTLSLGSGRGYFLQTDAPINPGNSGGALIDMAGRLMGINTAILTRGGGSNGVGFAIPANLVARVLEQAQAGNSRFVRPWAGIGGQGVDPGLAEALGLPGPEGVVVTDMHPDSPFAAAGLLPGDVILALGGQPVNSPAEVMFRLSVAGTGKDTSLRYVRAGEVRETSVALIPPPVGDRDETTVPETMALWGLTVARIDPALIADLGLPLSATGIVVTEARDLAARAGLRAGDIVLAINGEPVEAPSDVLRILRGGGRNWQVDALRQGQRLRLRFRV